MGPCRPPNCLSTYIKEINYTSILTSGYNCKISSSGAEWGGNLDKQAFSASSQLSKNSRAEAGRLNKPNELLQIADINVLNDMTGYL